MSRALLKFVRVAPLKARLIAREVQGMNAEYAIASLEFTPNKAAKLISKVIASAVANAGPRQLRQRSVQACLHTPGVPPTGTRCLLIMRTLSSRAHFGNECVNVAARSATGQLGWHDSQINP